MRPSLLKRMERFNKGLEILEELRNYEIDKFSTDLKLLSIAERNIQVCTEFIVDFSSYILSKLKVAVPDTYREIIRKIREEGIIDENLEKKLQEIVGLRNIIVHMYADIDAEIIYDNLEDIIQTLREAAAKLLEFSKAKNIDP
ncbi:MAG: DUF86 domain-containing protein [Thermofilum sp.]|uniref:type VII toxin-antitoxin system HepT family RNase toxin n=1 Tax=Thermofilum sp. TaxID=1961369 RepID=UPI00258506C2|nr:DUF86 domain-containing protein [Thermofilum sp.]MCI4409310.1 DUF86 domain-containing protein [Thermofilum sp.]